MKKIECIRPYAGKDRILYLKSGFKTDLIQIPKILAHLFYNLDLF